MKNTRYARHILILIALSLVLFVVVRVYLNLPKDVVLSEDVPSVATGSDLELTDVSFTETEGGRSVWSLKATNASYSKSGQLADFHDVEVLFYNVDQHESARLTAKKAVADLTNNEIVARGNVKVVTAEGGQLKTEQVRYQHAEKLLVTDELVTVDYLGAQIHGLGMTYSLSDMFLQLHANVSGYVPFSPGN